MGLDRERAAQRVRERGAQGFLERVVAAALREPRRIGLRIHRGERLLELERVTDEEFTKLGRASNNSPRGIWSDGDVMYVADASDGKVSSYNMPDAIDARLASLSLSDVDIGEFSGDSPEYEGIASEGATETTVEASAVQRQAPGAAAA